MLARLEQQSCLQHRWNHTVYTCGGQLHVMFILPSIGSNNNKGASKAEVAAGPSPCPTLA